MLPLFTQLWRSTLSDLHCPCSFSCEGVLSPSCERLPSLASVAPVHSAVKKHSLWPPLPLFTQLWRSTLSDLCCPGSQHCKGKPSLASTAPVHSSVKETTLCPTLPQFTQLWRNTLPALHWPSSFSCEGVPSLAYIASVHSAANKTLSCLHSPSSLICEGVPSLASIALVHSAVKEYSLQAVKDCPLWPQLPQFIQLWRSTLSDLHCPCSHSCEGELSLTYVALVHMLLWPTLPKFTQLWRSTLSGLTQMWRNTFSGLYCTCSLRCQEVPSLAAIGPVHPTVKWPPFSVPVHSAVNVFHPLFYSSLYYRNLPRRKTSWFWTCCFDYTKDWLPTHPSELC